MFWIYWIREKHILKISFAYFPLLAQHAFWSIQNVTYVAGGTAP